MIEQHTMNFAAPDPGGLSHARNLPSDASTSVVRESPPCAPFAVGSVTSEAAARRIEPTRRSKKEQVYRAILSCGARGATRTEVAALTGLTGDTVRPRVLELKGETDASFGTPRVWEGLTAERDGRAVLFAGVFAKNVREEDMARSEYEDAVADRQSTGGY